MDKRQHIACHFFDSKLVERLEFSRPTMTGASGSDTYILSHPHNTQKYILKELPRNLSLKKIEWTQRFSHWLRTSEYDITPIALTCHKKVFGHTKDFCREFSYPMIAAASDGTYWQCIEFMEGTPRKTPTTDNVRVAIEAVASLHCRGKAFTVPTSRTPTGWQRRVQQLSSILFSPQCFPKGTNLSGTENAEVHGMCNQFYDFLRSPEVVRVLRQVIAIRMPVMNVPVLQDCWWGHIFFSKTGQQITGIIDLDSAGRDDPAIDVSRLLGSWQTENARLSEKLSDLWPEAFETYKQVYDCEPDFPTRVQCLHDTAILCGIDRWFSWVLVENRHFSNMEWVVERIRQLFLATPHALKRLETHYFQGNAN